LDAPHDWSKFSLIFAAVHESQRQLLRRGDTSGVERKPEVISSQAK
jgi:hypothetical protein